MKLYCSYCSDTWVVREADPDDYWDAGEGSGCWWVDGVSLTPGRREEVETADDVKVGDKVFVVYISYDSGGTFGTDGGYGAVISATKSLEQAESVLAWAENRGPWPDGVLSKYHYWNDGSHFGLKGWQEWKSWDGYFEHNQQFFIREFEVKD